MLLETYKHQIISVSYLIVSMLAFVAVGRVTLLNKTVSSYFAGKRNVFIGWLATDYPGFGH